MLTVQNVSAAQAGSYYEKDDYYTEQGLMPSMFGGKAAERLGLAGEFHPDKFNAALRGVFDGQEWKQAPSHERAALDCTFSAPKSVSMAALVEGDLRVIEAHDYAVNQAMLVVESLARSRVTENGITEAISVNGIAYASFRHDTSRLGDPNLHTHNTVFKAVFGEDGKLRSLDNQEIFKAQKLLDATYKQVLAERLRALGYELTYTKDGFEIAGYSKKVLDIFSQRTTQINEKLQEQGLSRETASGAARSAANLDTRDKKVIYDRPQLTQYWIDKCAYLNFALPARPIENNRSKKLTINQQQRSHHEQGKARKEAVYKSIPSSDRRDPPPWARGNLHHVSQLPLARDGKTGEMLLPSNVRHNLVNVGAGTDPDLRWPEDRSGVGEVSRKAVSDAIQHFNERQSVIKNPYDLTAFAMQAAGYRCTRIEIEAAIEEAVKSGDLIVGLNKRALVSRHALEVENRIDTAYTRGLNTKPVFAALSEAHAGIEAMQNRIAVRIIAEKEKSGVALPDSERASIRSSCTLTEKQRVMVETIATSADRISVVEGDAGTGKTTAMEALKIVVESKGMQLLGLAPSAQAVDSLSAAGIKTITSQRGRFDEKFWATVNEKTVIVLDEAGLVDARAMDSILANIEDTGARLVVVGDTKQYGSVEAGRALDQLRVKAEEAGKLLRLDDMRRGRNAEMRETHFSARDLPAQALEKLFQAGHVIARQHERRRLEAIATLYAGIPVTDRASTLVLAGTNEDRIKLNTAIREKLGIEGGQKITSFEAKDFTEVQTKHLGSYEVGDAVRFNTKTDQFKKGEILTVVEKHPDLLIAQRSDGSTIQFIPGRDAGNVTIGRIEQMQLAAGDRIRFTASDKQAGYFNGDRGEVLRIEDGKAVVALDRTNKQIEISLNEKEPISIRYGYAQTGHSAQGATVKNGLLYLSSNDPTLDRKRLYTDITRAAENVKIVTDAVEANAIEKLRNAVSFSKVKEMARDALAPEKRKENERTPYISAHKGPEAWAEKIEIQDGTPEAIKKALEEAARKYGGKLHIAGSNKFKLKVARVAVEQNVNIKFSDRRLEAERQRMASEMQMAKGGQNREAVAILEQLAKREGLAIVEVSDKLNIGRIVGVTDTHVLQAAGRGQARIHNLARLQLTQDEKQKLEIGSKLEVDYRREKPRVAIMSQEQEKQIKRENGQSM